MRDHLLVTVTVAAAATAASALIAFPPVLLAQGATTGPGIIISVSGSATIPTRGMPVGGEIWATWYSLPPGKTVVESAGTAKWAYVEMALDGSAVVTGPSTPTCDFLSAGGRQAAGSENITDPGDVEACNYALLPGSRTENRGSQPYVFAGLAVGGPWKEGMEDDADLYAKVNGVAKSAHVDSSRFGEVEREILKTGAMTVVIRNVTMMPGARIVTTDHYPTLRMVENGRLMLSPLPESSNATGPKALAAYDVMEWDPANAGKQIVVSNTGDQPVQFVEWSITPAQGTKP